VKRFLLCFHQHRGIRLVSTFVFINIVAYKKLTFFLHVFSITSWHYPSFFIPLFLGVAKLRNQLNVFYSVT
jgi:hypothetical protein